MDGIQLPWGYITFGNNSLSIISTIDDPPEVRLASKSGSLGKISWSILGEDNKRQDEVGLLQGVRDDRNPEHGSLTLFLKGDKLIPSNDDSAMRHIFTMNHDGLEFFVPITFPEYYSPNRRYCAVLQNDGNFVLYKRVGNTWKSYGHLGGVQE